MGIEGRLRRDHPLRAVRALTDETLTAMERELAALYSGIGRPSIAPQMLLRAMLLQAMLLQAFYSVRSERQLMERMEFALLFRWFVGLGRLAFPAFTNPDAPPVRPERHVTTSITSGRTSLGCLDLLQEQGSPTGGRCGGAVPGDVDGPASGEAALVQEQGSSDPFSVDGTMIQAWSSMKSVKPIEPGEGPGAEPPPSSGGRNAEADFHGETHSNATHVLTTRLYKKSAGTEAKLAFLGHARDKRTAAASWSMPA